jgi:hypothetical protein
MGANGGCLLALCRYRAWLDVLQCKWWNTSHSLPCHKWTRKGGIICVTILLRDFVDADQLNCSGCTTSCVSEKRSPHASPASYAASVWFWDHFKAHITQMVCAAEVLCVREVLSREFLAIMCSSLSKMYALHILKPLEIMLCAFFCVIPRRLNFVCQRFGTLCSVFIGG